jgi:splicing factor 3B subunit 1|mmetsp:Transcript_93786/g.148090  ORF Transcript_93786/g.148090 Transcript_93786/m.148090 type:complete len:1253 (+) Transcript_93786:62-3820(+)
MAGKEGVSLESKGDFDSDLYGDAKKGDYNKEITEDKTPAIGGSKKATGVRPQDDVPAGADEADPFKEYTHGKKIVDREDEYKAQRHKRMISPDRADPYADSTPAPELSTYKDVMVNQQLDKEKAEVLKKIQKQKEEEGAGKAPGAEPEKTEKKKRRWDSSGKKDDEKKKTEEKDKWATPLIEDDGAETPIVLDEEDGTDAKKGGGWAATPGGAADEIGETPEPGQWGETPTPGAPKRKRARWDETPVAPSDFGATPVDVTPSDVTPGATPGATPFGGMGMGPTPGATPFGGMGAFGTPGATPLGTPGMAGMSTPVGLTPNFSAMTPEQIQAFRYDSEINERNAPMSDEDLDAIFPQSGYEIVRPPANYQPIRKSVMSTPTPTPGGTPFFTMDSPSGPKPYEVPASPAVGELPMVKPEDYSYFAPLLSGDTDDNLSPEEAKERKIMRLLLKVKNGTPPMRRAALRQLTDGARSFGPGPLFNQILPLLMSSTLEDQERHLLVKVIDRVLYKLDDMVRPYVHKILVVIEPLLIDEDYFARVEGREIISNLAKAAGLATMIATMRPDIDHADEYVRNTTARAFAVVASALGIPALLLFLRAVCQSKKSWQARHTGIKIVQQIAVLMGCAVLPHLKQMVDILAHGLQDEQQKVRTITALALAALAEAATPYGIEAFDTVLRPLWKGICEHRGKGLAAFLKAIGYIIPLMDAEHANYYTREVMIILIREFSTPDEEMKKIVLKVVKQCVATEGVEPSYIREDILPPFFRNFWVVRMALDRRNYRQLVDTTVEIAQKVGGADIIGRIVEDLKDASEPYRKMVMETIDKVIANLGVADIDSRLEEQIIDGIVYAFQEQTSDDTTVMLNGFGTVVNSLGSRVKPYLPQIAGIIRWRLNTPSARVRQQAADLIARIAVVMKQCGEEQMMGHLGLFLYEYLGEEYPEVLGSILGALKAIVNVIGMTKMTPPIKDLLPRLTPILKNRHEKVQENCIDLVGRIADRGAELAPPREWNRICFDLLELLKAHKKAIRRATVNTFGYIAKAIGPHDVLSTLLNNLKVQERQLRICTVVAIAIVAETCGPFTVLPALMNEYRVPELNVQNGVLKSLSFMFEYIGEMGKDYIHAVTPLLEDALMDRDLVHRQTAAWTIKHLALGVQGMNCEDALQHLMNYVWPNVFETSPHLIMAVFDAIDGFRVSLGPTKVLQYLLQGLWHPARRVRNVYWRLYNNLYIGSQDGLIPSYPKLEDDSEHCYRRTELELLL